MPKNCLETSVIHACKKFFSAKTARSMINAFIHVKTQNFSENYFFSSFD